MQIPRSFPSPTGIWEGEVTGDISGDLDFWPHQGDEPTLEAESLRTGHLMPELFNNSETLFPVATPIASLSQEPIPSQTLDRGSDTEPFHSLINETVSTRHTYVEPYSQYLVMAGYMRPVILSNLQTVRLNLMIYERCK